MRTLSLSERVALAVAAAVLLFSAVAFARVAHEGRRASSLSFDVAKISAQTKAVRAQVRVVDALNNENRARLEELRAELAKREAARQATAVYLIEAMYSWKPPSAQRAYGEAEPEARARYASIVDDIATIVHEEPPIFAGDDSRNHTAILLLAIAFFESSFAEYVDKGRCIDSAWRATAFGHAMAGVHADCDSANAYSMFQIHPEEGIVLLGDTWTRAKNKPSAWIKANPTLVLNGWDLIHDRKTAVRVAEHMIRLSGPTLEGYTGEKPETGYPKAKDRRGLAERYWRTHAH